MRFGPQRSEQLTRSNSLPLPPQLTSKTNNTKRGAYNLRLPPPLPPSRSCCCCCCCSCLLQGYRRTCPTRQRRIEAVPFISTGEQTSISPGGTSGDGRARLCVHSLQILRFTRRRKAWHPCKAQGHAIVSHSHLPQLQQTVAIPTTAATLSLSSSASTARHGDTIIVIITTINHHQGCRSLKRCGSAQIVAHGHALGSPRQQWQKQRQRRQQCQACRGAHNSHARAACSTTPPTSCRHRTATSPPRRRGAAHSLGRGSPARHRRGATC